MTPLTPTETVVAGIVWVVFAIVLSFGLPRLFGEW
jgi:hypothetical protein